MVDTLLTFSIVAAFSVFGFSISGSDFVFDASHRFWIFLLAFLLCLLLCIILHFGIIFSHCVHGGIFDCCFH